MDEFKYEGILAGDGPNDSGIVGVGWHRTVPEAVSSIITFLKENQWECFWAKVVDQNGDVVWKGDPWKYVWKKEELE